MQYGALFDLGNDACLASCLRWDALSQFDLDLQALIVDSGGRIIDAVYYNSVKACGKGVIHSGDDGGPGNAGGRFEGREEVWITLGLLPTEVHMVLVVVCCYTGTAFQNVPAARLSFEQLRPTKRMLSDGPIRAATSGLLAAVLVRQASGEWLLRGVSEELAGARHFMDCVPELCAHIVAEIPTANRRQKIAFAMEKGDALFPSSPTHASPSSAPPMRPTHASPSTVQSHSTSGLLDFLSTVDTFPPPSEMMQAVLRVLMDGGYSTAEQMDGAIESDVDRLLMSSELSGPAKAFVKRAFRAATAAGIARLQPRGAQAAPPVATATPPVQAAPVAAAIPQVAATPTPGSSIYKGAVTTPAVVPVRPASRQTPTNATQSVVRDEYIWYEDRGGWKGGWKGGGGKGGGKKGKRK